MAKRKVKPEEPVEYEGRDPSVPLDYYSFFKDTYGGYDDYEIKLYRRERAANNKTKRTFLARYYSAPPLEEDIAMDHGTGDFTAQSVDPVSGEFHSRDFSIDHSLRHLYNPNHGSGPVSAGPAPAPAALLPPDPMKYMKDIMQSIIAPMMEIAKAGNNGNGNGNNQVGQNMELMSGMMDGLMSSFTKGIGKMQTTMIDQQIENVKKIKAPTSAPVQEEGGGEWGWIIDLVKAFGAKMFDAEGNLTEGAASTIQKNPMFNEAINDQQKLDSLYFSLATDPNVGKAKADAMFSAVGVEPISDEDFKKVLDEQAKA